MSNSFFFISLFFYFLQGIIHVYFIHHYLIPKYGIKSFIFGLFFFLLYLYILFTYIYLDVPLRTTLGLLCFELIGFCLYDGKLFKRLLAGPLLCTCSVIAEIVFQCILVFILNMPVMTLLSPLALFLTLFFNTLLYFIIIKLLLYFLSRSFTTTPQYSKLFFASITTVFLIAIILSESLYLNQLFFVVSVTDNYTSSLIITFLCFFACILLNIYIYYSIKSLKSDLAKQTLFQLMHDEYLSQINDLLLSKHSKKQVSYLRHDIINYLQTISQYSKEDTSSDTKN